MEYRWKRKWRMSQIYFMGTVGTIGGNEWHENMIPRRRFVFLAKLTHDGWIGEGFIKYGK